MTNFQRGWPDDWSDYKFPKQIAFVEGTCPGGDLLPAAGGLSGRVGQKKPITHKGVTYPSHKSLALALGLSKQAVTQAKQLGRLDRLGIGRGEVSRIDLMRNARIQPVTAAGRSWPSQRACAQDLGTSDSYVCLLLRTGKLDRFAAKRLGQRNA